MTDSTPISGDSDSPRANTDNSGRVEVRSSGWDGNHVTISGQDYSVTGINDNGSMRAERSSAFSHDSRDVHSDGSTTPSGGGK
ncbi:MAG: hypothetical protein ABIF08_00980 [Nanoarchaeota archaeon]